jgi:rhodanese-related sulfurtransferase
MRIDDILEAARGRIERATVEATRQALSDGAVVIDVRDSADLRRTGVIPGSIPIARSVLEWRCDTESEWRDDRVARPDARVIVVCKEGYSSSLAADSLRTLGFTRVGDLVGGMDAWLAAGLPTEPYEGPRGP